MRAPPYIRAPSPRRRPGRRARLCPRRVSLLPAMLFPAPALALFAAAALAAPAPMLTLLAALSRAPEPADPGPGPGCGAAARPLVLPSTGSGAPPACHARHAHVR